MIKTAQGEAPVISKTLTKGALDIKLDRQAKSRVHGIRRKGG